MHRHTHAESKAIQHFHKLFLVLIYVIYCRTMEAALICVHLHITTTLFVRAMTVENCWRTQKPAEVSFCVLIWALYGSAFAFFSLVFIAIKTPISTLYIFLRVILE